MSGTISGKSVKMIYFAPGDIQVPRVERQCLIYFCEALTELGIDLELVAMGIRVMKTEPKAVHPLKLYRLRTEPKTRIVKSLSSQTSGETWFALNRIAVHLIVGLLHIWRARKSPQQLVFYTRNYASAYLFDKLRRGTRGKLRIIFEIHSPPTNKFQKRVLQLMDGMVVNTHALAEDLRTLISGKFSVATHMGVNLSLFESLRMNQADARAAVGLPLYKRLVVYAGKVYWGYEEVELLLRAASALDPEIEMIIVGGRADQVAMYNEQLTRLGLRNVRFTGFVEPSKVHLYTLSADVLVSYYPKGMELNKYRSPLKLFEYMAAGRAVIVGDYPVLQEILGSKDPAGVFVEPDNPEKLAHAINKLCLDDSTRIALGCAALNRVRMFTWAERASRVMTLIKNISLANAATSSVQRQTANTE